MTRKLLRFLYYGFPIHFLNGYAFPCRNLVIELTYRCNLSCKMCSIMTEIAAREAQLSSHELNRYDISSILSQIPSGSSVTFSGGEIFLKKDIDKIIQHATIRHKVTLASNGVLLSRYADLIVRSQVQAVGLSLDGPPKVHNRIRNVPNAFENLVAGIQAVEDLKRELDCTLPRLSVNTVILKDNYLQLPELVPLIKQVGLSSCTFQILDPSLRRSGVALNHLFDFNEMPFINMQEMDPSRLEQSLIASIEEGIKQGVRIRFLPDLSIGDIVRYYQGDIDLSRWSCQFPWETIRISPYGDVYPCLNYSIGNIHEDRLMSLWNSRGYRRFRRGLKSQSIYPACTGCCKMLLRKAAK